MELSIKERFHHETLSLITEKGLSATTMRDIADRLGCDVANIYNYIPSKQHLLEEHLFSISADFHRGIDDIRSAAIGSKYKMKQIIALYVRLSSDKPLQVALLVNEWRGLKEPKKSLFLDEKGAYENKVREVINQGIEEKLFRTSDPDILFHLFLSNLRWLFEKKLEKEQSYNPIELGHQLEELIFNGLLIK
jgi:AcrR family transcriptional regulator